MNFRNAPLLKTLTDVLANRLPIGVLAVSAVAGPLVMAACLRRSLAVTLRATTTELRPTLLAIELRRRSLAVTLWPAMTELRPTLLAIELRRRFLAVTLWATTTELRPTLLAIELRRRSLAVTLRATTTELRPSFLAKAFLAIKRWRWSATVAYSAPIAKLGRTLPLSTLFTIGGRRRAPAIGLRPAKAELRMPLAVLWLVTIESRTAIERLVA